jgi:hypothetical protein
MKSLVESQLLVLSHDWQQHTPVCTSWKQISVLSDPHPAAHHSVGVEAVEIMQLRESGLRVFRLICQVTHMARRKVLEAEYYACHGTVLYFCHVL